MVFGQLAPQTQPHLGFPVHYTGHLHDNLSLRAVYSAADVMVIPSRVDNLPNTGLEAHACGTQIVAFDTGGLSDIVDDRVTGVLAEPFESASLSAAIRWVLKDPPRLRILGVSARKRAERLWNPTRVADMYKQVYKNVLRHPYSVVTCRFQAFLCQKSSKMIVSFGTSQYTTFRI